MQRISPETRRLLGKIACLDFANSVDWASDGTERPAVACYVAPGLTKERPIIEFTLGHRQSAATLTTSWPWPWVSHRTVAERSAREMRAVVAPYLVDLSVADGDEQDHGREGGEDTGDGTQHHPRAHGLADDRDQHAGNDGVDDAHDDVPSREPVGQSDPIAEAICLQHARLVVVMACDKVRLQLRCELEVGVP